MNPPLFIDTSYTVALINPRDQMREKALQVRSEIIGRKLVITETVLVETLNYFSEFKAELKQTALFVLEKLLINPDVEVVEQTSFVFHDGLNFFESRLDKGYNLTDCISMNVCHERDVIEVLTNDHHFEQEGFRILL